MSKPKIALSFSRLSDFEACPNKFKLKYITKEYPDESDNPAFVKGNIIHKQLEDFINYLGNGIDEPILNTHTKNVAPLLQGLHSASNGQIFSEKQIAVNQDWERCDWFDKPYVVKYRAIIDCLVFMDDSTLYIIDFKSGKIREYEDGPTTQLKLTAAMLFNLYPNIESITSCYLFVEHKKTVKVKFNRGQLKDLMKPFNEAHKMVNEETEFKYKKHQYCHWCKAEADQCPIKM